MDELEQFKKEIDLREFAASRGYALDKKASSRNSAIMRNGDNDKIIIAKDGTSNDWIYFSVRNSLDNGTIVDFLTNRDGRNLGLIRKNLRAWLGLPVEKKQIPTFEPLSPTTKDTRQAVLDYEKADFVSASPYLIGRGLDAILTSSPRFIHRFKVDWRGNVLFPHYNREGLCGFEKKNKDFNGFASGGVKGLWSSVCFKTDKLLVVSESAIDGLSYQALNPDLILARFLSIGGSMNPDQLELLGLAMKKMAGGKVHLAFDNDLDGEKMAEQVRGIAPSSVTLSRPLAKSKDWNQDLKNKLGLK